MHACVHACMWVGGCGTILFQVASWTDGGGGGGVGGEALEEGVTGPNESSGDFVSFWRAGALLPRAGVCLGLATRGAAPLLEKAPESTQHEAVHVGVPSFSKKKSWNSVLLLYPCRCSLVVGCARCRLQPGRAEEMSNSQTPGEVGGEVGLRRLGLPRPAPGLREAPNASQLDALGLPQSCLRASSLPKGHVGLRAQVPVGEGVCYGDGNLGVCTKRGLNGARGAPPERGSDPDKIRAGFSQKSAEEKRFQAGESVPVCSFSAAVEAELIEAAKRTVESYREDGPQIGFVFDEVPVVGTSMAEIKGGVGRALQQDFNHTAGEAWNLVSACRPPAFGAPWGFMYPPILPPVAHALATHRHPRLWGGAEGRKQHFFGYGHPPRSPINEPHNGLFGIAYQGSSSCDKIKDGTSSEGKTIDTQVTSKEKQDKSDGSLKKQESPLLLILKGFNNTNEDSELEMQKLMSMKLSTMSESEQAEVIKLEQSGQSLQDILKIKLPQFPNICEKPHNSVLAKILDKGILGNLLMVWGTLYSFGDMLGLWPCTIDDLAEAFLEGRGSKLLAEVHVGLLRLLIAEMEEAHISGTEKVKTGAQFLPDSTLSS